MHGHSRKKNVFMYGPEFPIHDGRYFKMRMIPKLMSEKSELFRFFSCKFRVAPCKETTARVVLWNEFNITNCFTIEASFHGYFNKERVTLDFDQSHFLDIGEVLASSIFEYLIITEQEARTSKDRRLHR